MSDVFNLIAVANYCQQCAPNEHNAKYIEFLETLPWRMPKEEAIALWREELSKESAS